MSDALELEFAVDAPVAHAFEMWTARIEMWWPRDHTVSGDSSAAIVFEPREGGRIFERTPAGDEHAWGEVLAWEPPARLVLAWRINGQFKCDPAVHTEVEVRFDEAGDGTTRIEFEHRLLENLGDGRDQAAQAMDGGWGTILARFKDVAEA